MILAVLISTIALFVVFLDWIYLRKSNRRAILLEFIGLSGVILIAVRAEWFTQLAQRLGVGRGVDLVIYPILIWLFREAILGRVRYHRQRSEITGLIRHIAISSRLEQAGAATRKGLLSGQHSEAIEQIHGHTKTV